MAKGRSKMNLRKIAREALDEAKLTGVVTMDGGPQALGPGQNGGGWLQAHDDRYHGGHYEDGQRCKLREKLKSADEADLAVDANGGGSLAQMLERMPTEEQFNGLMNRLRESGAMTDEDIADISAMFAPIAEALENGDEEGAELTDDLMNDVRDLNDIYQALRDAYGDEPRRDEPPAPVVEETTPSETPESENHQENGDGGPTEEQIQDAISRLEAQFGAGYNIGDGVREALRTGAVEPSYMRQAVAVLGMDHPVVRALQGRSNEVAAAAEQPIRQDEGEAHEQTAQQTPDWLSNMDTSFEHGEFRRRKGDRYDWPFNARNPVTAEGLTEDMLRNVVCHLPFGFRSTWKLEMSASRALDLLKDPNTQGYRHQRILDSMLGSNNRDAQRYIAAMKALHPGCIEEREHRVRAANNRRDANELADVMERQDDRGDGVTPNLTDEQYREATDTIVSRVGDENRDIVERGIAAFRNGRISPDQVQNLERYLPGNSPVLAEARRISQARMSEYEREQARVQAAIPHFHPPKASDEVIAQDKELADAAGITFKGAGSPLTERSGTRRFGSGDSNCWHNANAIVCQMRGLDVFPKMRGRDLMAYGSCKNAMSRAYDRVDSVSGSDVRNWLNTTNFSNGDAISTWSGSHNKVFIFNEGTWYEYDGFFGTIGVPVSASTISGNMSFTHKDSISLDRGVGGYYYGEEKEKRVVLAMAKRELRKEAGNMSLQPSDAEIEDKAKDMLARSQGSYYIPISKPLIPEMLRSNQE